MRMKRVTFFAVALVSLGALATSGFTAPASVVVGVVAGPNQTRPGCIEEYSYTGSESGYFAYTHGQSQVYLIDDYGNGTAEVRVRLSAQSGVAYGVGFFDTSGTLLASKSTLVKGTNCL